MCGYLTEVLTLMCDPTEAQTGVFRSHCGAQRYAYNFGLALIRANLDQRAAERSYGLDGDLLTPLVAWSAYGLRRAWNEAKREVTPWCAENSKEAYSSGLANLATALSNWSASKNGTRAGRTVAFPRFKFRRSRLTCRFTTGAFGLGADRRHIQLPRIGLVRTRESTRKRHLDGFLAALRRAQRKVCRRRGPDRRTRKVASNRWRQATARVAALHVRVAAARRDGLRKLTTWLVAEHDAEHDTVVVEDLNVVGMVRNRRLARAITGVGMAELRRQVEYKAADAGVHVVVADRWYPSSKTCSACSAVKATLTLAEREFVCESCGTRLDRDLNAAFNLAALADQAVHGELRRDIKQSAGNPRKTAIGGNGYRHGKAAISRQRRPREVVAP